MKEIHEITLDLLREDQIRYNMLKKTIVNCIVKDSFVDLPRFDLDKLVTILSVIEPIFVLQVEEKIEHIRKGEKK